MDEVTPTPDSAPAGPDNAAAVRRQFGANAGNYAGSRPHARGASLGRLVELLEPQPTWQGLDIATAAGHAAWAIAPHVAHIVATDLLPEMLTVAQDMAAERGIANVSFELADAQALPFADDAFDLVTCRIAAHHFPQPERFVAEVARVLRPDGRFALVDNIVPGEAEPAQFANHFEAQRDPSHARCLSMEEWQQLMAEAGLDVLSAETADKRMNFEGWANNMSVAADLRIDLLGQLHDASDGAKAFLRPEFDAADDQANTWFTLTEGILVARS